VGLNYTAASRERKRLLDRIEADWQVEMASMFGLDRDVASAWPAAARKKSNLMVALAEGES